MKSTKTFHALYNDDDVLLSAVKIIKEKHYDIEEIYTPFPDVYYKHLTLPTILLV